MLLSPPDKLQLGTEQDPPPLKSETCGNSHRSALASASWSRTSPLLVPMAGGTGSSKALLCPRDAGDTW